MVKVWELTLNDSPLHHLHPLPLGSCLLSPPTLLPPAQKLSKGGAPGSWSFAIPQGLTEPGLYGAQVSVGKSTHEVGFAITRDLRLSSASVLVAGKKGGDADSFSATLQPGKAASKTIQLSAGQQLHITASATDAAGKTWQPAIATATLSSADGSVRQSWASSTEESGALRWTIDAASAQSLGAASASGDYKLTVRVGDPAAAEQVAWNMGTVSLAAPGVAPTPEPPLYTKPLLHESDTALEPLPEKHHTFAAQHVPPASVLPLAFVGILVAGTAVWLGWVVRAAGGFTAAPAAWAQAGFFSCLLATLGIYLGYWLGHYRMFDALQYLACLSVPTLIFGRALLGSLHAAFVAKKE